MSSCPPESDFFPFTDRLERLGVPYAVTGSVAAMVYSEPRFTNDVDLIIRLDLATARKLREVFPSDQFYCPPLDSIIAEISRDRRGHFNLLHIDTGFKADVYLQGSDPLRQWALEHAREVKLGNSVLSVAPMEYVIVRKLEYFREGGSEKHLRDIAAMLRISGADLDRNALQEFISERGLEVEWDKASR